MRSEILQTIAETIRNNRRFLVTSHSKPDGDAMGALLAMTFILKKMGKAAVPHLEDPVPTNCAFLPGVEDIVHEPWSAVEYDVAFILDCGDFSRIGKKLEAFVSKIPVIVSIDHHVGTKPYGHINWVETPASSTCEMLCHLAQELGIIIDTPLATQLYTGLMTDTGSFRFSNTDQHVLELAAKLAGAGANPAHVAQNIYESNQPQRLHLLAQVLMTVQFFQEDRLATAQVTQEMLAASGTTAMDSEGFINELRSVKPVELAIFFREGPDGITHVSMRSKENVDVAALARSHGGGGHRRAAAFRQEGDLPEIRRRITMGAIAYLKQSSHPVEAH